MRRRHRPHRYVFELTHQLQAELGHWRWVVDDKDRTHHIFCLNAKVRNWLDDNVLKRHTDRKAYDVDFSRAGQVEISFWDESDISKLAHRIIEHYKAVDNTYALVNSFSHRNIYFEGPMTMVDPFFGDNDCVVILEDREELSNGTGTMTPELRDWLIAHAPHTKWTYRRYGPGGDDPIKAVFKFMNESEALHFKMRWQ
jgi:hypothetical protein